MSLIEVNLPPPSQLRGGWAALAAVCASRGWSDLVYATSDQWLYNDGGGNWACLRFIANDKIILLGHDHEYSETYFGEAAAYFEEAETDLLQGVPEWWGQRLEPGPMGEWVGFVYGWNGIKWQRASYNNPDGFNELDLLGACSQGNTEKLKEFALDAPGLGGMSPRDTALSALVSADGNISAELLESVAPGWDVLAGTAAAQQFLEMPL